MHALHPEYHRWKLFPFSFQHVSEDLLPYGTQNCNTSFTYVRNMRIKNNNFKIASQLTKYPDIWSLYYFSISQQDIDVCCVLYYSMSIFCCRKVNKYSNIWLLGFLRFIAIFIDDAKTAELQFYSNRCYYVSTSLWYTDQPN